VLGLNDGLHPDSRAFVGRQKRLDLFAQFQIASASPVKNSHPMFRVGFRRTVKHFFDLCPAFRRHNCTYKLRISL
jgi:hypothetical protein